MAFRLRKTKALLAILVSGTLASCAIVPLDGHGGVGVTIEPVFPLILHGGHRSHWGHGGHRRYRHGGHRHHRGHRGRRGHRGHRH